MKRFRHINNRSILQGMLIVLLFLNRPTTALRASEYDLYRPVYAFDFLSFKYEESGKSLLEIFGQVPTRNLIFIKFEDGFFASYQLTITLHDSSGNDVGRQNLIDSVKVQTFKDIDRPRAPRLIRFGFLIEPGEYEARMKLTDLETLKALNFQSRIKVSDYEKSGLELSDLQIATSISAANHQSVLIKNDMEIVPNILRIVRSELPVLYVYSELYNLQYSTEEQNKEFIVSYIIENKEGKEVKSVKRRNKKLGDTCVLNAGISVADLDSGEYQLIVNVEDLDSAQKIQKSTQFFVTKPSLPITKK